MWIVLRSPDSSLGLSATCGHLDGIRLLLQAKARVLTQGTLDQTFVDRLNQTNEKLRQPIEAAAKDLNKRRVERRRLIQKLRSGNEDLGAIAEDRDQQ